MLGAMISAAVLAASFHQLFPNGGINLRQNSVQKRIFEAHTLYLKVLYFQV
jgi:hypothetical protein